MKKVAILGFSDLPQSESVQVYNFYKSKGAEITAFYWDNPQLPADIQAIQINKDDHIDALSDFDIAVRGPAVHPRQIPEGVTTTSLTNLFFEHCPTRNIIGITGTKGKGTTSTLIAKILEHSGRKVWLGGNIGKPLLGDLDTIAPEDWVVFELSAAQLIDMQFSPNIGVCLMVVPEHLDWHTDLDEYIAAKGNIFTHQREGDTAVYLGTNEISAKLGARSKGQKIPYFMSPGARAREDGMIIIGANDELLHKSEVKLRGEHNLQNVCAAITATWDIINADVVPVKKAVHSFAGLPYRIEEVASIKGITFINDSFSTTPETAIACIKSFAGPKIIILGGSDKGIPFDELCDEVVRSNVKHVIAIGETGQKIAALLRARGYSSVTTGLKSMDEIIGNSLKIAESGDTVLLSPGSASFDMFANYKDRGDKFNQAVRTHNI